MNVTNADKLTFASFKELDTVTNRGLCIYKNERSKVAVFSRRNSYGTRSFDVVDYADSKEGHALYTTFDAKDAKNYAGLLAG